MKSLLILLLLLSSSAFSYQEKIEVNGTSIKGSWISQDLNKNAIGPVRGYFNVSTDIFQIDGSCDDFMAQVHKLIGDWKNYPRINLYSLENCTGSSGKSTIVFLYGVDLWDPAQISTQQKFLKDHQGMEFAGHKLDFSQVTSLTVNSTLSLGVLDGNNLGFNYQAKHSLSYQYEDIWYPHYLEAINFLAQPNRDIFLKYVETEFGSKQEKAIEKNLPSSNYVSLSDAFTLNLANGKVGDFWLGWGGSKHCGTQSCYASSTLLRPFSLAR